MDYSDGGVIEPVPNNLDAKVTAGEYHIPVSLVDQVARGMDYIQCRYGDAIRQAHA